MFGLMLYFYNYIATAWCCRRTAVTPLGVTAEGYTSIMVVGILL